MCAYIYIWYAHNYRWLNPIISQLVGFIAHVEISWHFFFPGAPEATTWPNRAHPWRNCGMQQCSWETCCRWWYSPPMALRVGKMIHGVTLLLGVTLFSDNPTWSRRCFWLRWSCLLFFSQTLVYKCTNVNCQATSTSGRSELSPGGLFTPLRVGWPPTPQVYFGPWEGLRVVFPRGGSPS